MSHRKPVHAGRSRAGCWTTPGVRDHDEGVSVPLPGHAEDAEASRAPGTSVGTEPDRPGWKRDITVFLTGQTITLLGSMLVQYAVLWHLTLQTRSGTVLAVSSVVGFLPQAVVSIFGGVWADRLDRKLLIIAADAVIALTTLGLALVMLTGADDLWLIYVTLAIRSAGAGIQMPAVSALLPQIVPTDKLMRVNGINGTIQAGMMLLAPAMAAAVYATWSIVAIFFIDVGTAVIGIGLLLLVTVPRLVRTDAEPVGYFDDLVAGVRYVVTHTFVRWVLSLFAVVFLVIVAPSYLTPLMVVRTFGAEVWKLTVNELAFSIGMMIGGGVVATWAASRSRMGLILGSTFVFGGLSVGMGLSTNMWVFFSLMFALGLAVPFFSTPSMTVLQETVEPEMQGRVFGFVGIVMALAMPIGMAVVGPLADRYRVETLLLAAGLALFVIVGLAVALPSGRHAMAAAGEHTQHGVKPEGATAG
jgi:DHA3 family macrolide efflux protein-like MFS transporter